MLNRVFFAQNKLNYFFPRGIGSVKRNRHRNFQSSVNDYSIGNHFVKTQRHANDYSNGNQLVKTQRHANDYSHSLMAARDYSGLGSRSNDIPADDKSIKSFFLLIICTVHTI